MGMRAFWRIWGHVIVLALLLPLALSSSLPLFARALGGPAPHVCHCAVSGGHSTCGCPICNPDRDDLRFNEVSIRGQCGDEDRVFGATLGLAVPAPPVVAVLAAAMTGQRVPQPSPELRTVFLTPPTPPPRLARA